MTVMLEIRPISAVLLTGDCEAAVCDVCEERPPEYFTTDPDVLICEPCMFLLTAEVVRPGTVQPEANA